MRVVLDADGRPVTTGHCMSDPVLRAAIDRPRVEKYNSGKRTHRLSSFGRPARSIGCQADRGALVREMLADARCIDVEIAAGAAGMGPGQVLDRFLDQLRRVPRQALTLSCRFVAVVA